MHTYVHAYTCTVCIVVCIVLICILLDSTLARVLLHRVLPLGEYCMHTVLLARVCILLLVL